MFNITGGFCKVWSGTPVIRFQGSGSRGIVLAILCTHHLLQGSRKWFDVSVNRYQRFRGRRYTPSLGMDAKT